jgi:hypothetical protein
MNGVLVDRMIFGQKNKKESAALLLYQLTRNKELHRGQVKDTGLAPQMSGLRRWQAQRLARTYADLAENPRYRLAITFFLQEIYGDKDFSQRDHDVERVYPIMKRTLPASALLSLAMALELNALSYELDAKLLEVLSEEPGVNDHITEQTYAEAYRRADNYPQRRHQIELIGKLGADLDRIVVKPYIYATLRLARTPAHLAGFGQLQAFLERGFVAFRHMHGADYFMDTIIRRESEILDRIYSHHPHPFQLD